MSLNYLRALHYHDDRSTEGEHMVGQLEHTCAFQEIKFFESIFRETETSRLGVLVSQQFGNGPTGARATVGQNVNDTSNIQVVVKVSFDIVVKLPIAFKSRTGVFW